METTPSEIPQVGDGGNGTVNDTEESKMGSDGEVNDTDFDVTPLIQQLMQHDGSKADDELLNVVTKIRETFDNESKPDSEACDTKNVQTILKTEGCVAKFVQLLDRHDHWSLQGQSANILANVAHEGVEESQAVVEAGALPRIISLLESPESDVRVSAAFALRSISSHPDNRGVRSNMLDLGVIPKLLPLLEHTSEGLLLVVMTLRHLCRIEDPPTPFNKLALCVGPLATLLADEDARVSDCASLALLSVAYAHGTTLLAVLTPTFIQAMSELPVDKYRPLILSPTMRLFNVMTSLMIADKFPTSRESNESTSDEEEEEDDSVKVTKVQRTTKRGVAASVTSPGVSTRRTVRKARRRPL